MVVIDSNKNNKAIYFQSLEEAQKIRMVYLHQFKIKINVPQLMGRCARNIKKGYLESFYQKLISRHRMVRKSVSKYSRNLVS